MSIPDGWFWAAELLAEGRLTMRAAAAREADRELCPVLRGGCDVDGPAVRGCHFAGDVQPEADAAGAPLFLQFGRRGRRPADERVKDRRQGVARDGRPLVADHELDVRAVSALRAHRQVHWAGAGAVLQRVAEQ